MSLKKREIRFKYLFPQSPDTLSDQHMDFFYQNILFSALDAPSYTPILTWNMVEKKVSWGVIVLLGGGFAIARASIVSYRKSKYTYHQ